MTAKILIDSKTWEEVLLVKRKKKKKSSFKGVLFLVAIIAIIYFNGARIQTIMSFPGMWSETLQEHWMEKVYAEYSEGKVVWLFLDNKVKDTIIYFHGNGESLNYFVEDMKYLGDLGYNVMAPDYPSYSESEGFPYEKNVYAANEAFFKKVVEDRKIKQKNIIIFGYSVWSASAVEFAKRNPKSKALVIMSWFTSRYDMSKKYFGVPMQKMFGLKNSFNNKEKLKNIKIPTLIIHWNTDKIVPYYMGEENFVASAFENKRFIELDWAGHNGILTNRFWDWLKEKIMNIADNTMKENLKYGQSLKPYLELFFEWQVWKKDKIKLIWDKAQDLKYLFNMEDDKSLTKFVSAKKAFNNPKYIPEDLVEITWNILIKQKSSMKLRAEALYNLEKMWQEFTKKFSKKLSLVSTYRSYATQKAIKDGWCPDEFCSKAWFSEHQSGLAVDLFEATTQKEFLSKPSYKKYFEWLNSNAHKYGFHNTYQKGLKIDTYNIEPWHWRYMWVPLATLLKENNLTIAEYYNLINTEEKW